MFILDRLYKVANGRPLILTSWCQKCYSARDFYLNVEGLYECVQCDAAPDEKIIATGTKAF